MRTIILLFFLSFCPFSGILKAQLDATSINHETEFKDNQLTKSALKRIKFENNIGLIKVSDSLIGAVNRKGNIIIPPSYREISKKNAVFILQNYEGNYHFFVTNKLLTPSHCDAFSVQQNIILYAINQLWGAYIITNKKIEEIKPEYKHIETSDNKLLLLEYPKWNIRDKNKDYWYYADSLFFIDGHLIYARNGFAGLLSDEAKELTKAVYSNPHQLDVDSIKFKLGELNHLPYDSLQPIFSNHDDSYLESLDSVLTSADTLKYFNDFKQVTPSLLIAGKDSLVGVFDNRKQKFIIPVSHTKIIPEYSEKIFLIYDTLKFSIIDFDGIVLSEPHRRFDTVYNFHEGRARFLKAGKLGFIDRRGNVRVAPQYKYLRDFHDGASAVFLNSKWGFIDNDEAILVQPLYDEVMDFQNGIAAVKKGKLWYFVKKNGQEPSNIKYDSVRYSGNKYWLVYKDKKVGLVDATGRERLGARYEAMLVGGELIGVKKFDKWGIVDAKENSIVPIEYDFIDCSKNIFILLKKSAVLEKEMKYGN